MTDTNDLEVIYYGDLVQGNLVKGSTILSEKLQIPDSLVGVLIASEPFKKFFESEKTRALLETQRKLSMNARNKLLISLNNAVQNVQLSDKANKVYLKNLLKQVEGMSTLNEFENSFDHLVLALKFISHSFYQLRMEVGEEEKDETKEDQEALTISSEDQKNFLMFDSVIEDYNKAQELIKELNPSDILKFLKAECGRYDSFYSVQEFINFIFRNLYHTERGMEPNLDLALNLYLGVPIYHLSQKKRESVLNWVNRRIWPEESDCDNNEDELRRVGVVLGKWVNAMISVLAKLENNDFDVVCNEETTQFHSEIQSTQSQLLKVVHSPVLKGELANLSVSFFELSKDCYLTNQSLDITFINGNELFTFQQIQVSSMANVIKEGVFEHISNTLRNKAEIQGEEYIAATPRNSTQASFEFQEKIIDTNFVGDSIIFYNVDGFKKKVLEENTHRLVFVQTSLTYMVPFILEKNIPLNDLADIIRVKLMQNQIELDVSALQQRLTSKYRRIDWTQTLDQFYSNMKVDGKKSEMQEGGNSPFYYEDENSKIALKFSICEDVKTRAGETPEKFDRIKPAYKNGGETEVPSFKVNPATIFKNIHTENSIQGLKPEFFNSEIIGISMIHHSSKINFLDNIKLNPVEFGLEGPATEYEVFAILTKSYRGFDLLFKSKDEETKEYFYSSNSNTVQSMEVVAAKKAAVVYYTKKEATVEK